MEFQSRRSSSTMMMGALSTLSPHQFSTLSQVLGSTFHLHRRRRLALLLSPALFSLSLRHLRSLSLHHKSLLIARFHLSTLKHLTLNWDVHVHSGGSAGLLRLRDVDSALLLLLLSEFRHHHPLPLQGLSTSKCRGLLLDYVLGRHMFAVSALGLSTSTTCGVVSSYIHHTARFLDVIGCSDIAIGKTGREVATSVATVVSLPSIKVPARHTDDDNLFECVICKEEMREGREVCKLPCEHLFHWGCVLPWLKKRNTCPYCRFRLPTDDVFGEIERLWGLLVNKSRMSNCQ
ncbi:hypothetical protein Sjap_001662 [Stephania japonica]|uniref:RING-type domain-containing protein n=1 Tax=Stephania japonica TaxID=461633 RepID=A0AAP0KKD1_9MAGN